MSGRIEDLPPEVREKLLSYCRVEDEQVRVVDLDGLLRYIVEQGGQYPVLHSLVKIDKEFLIERFKQTGELPAGVKMIRKTTQEGDNLTKLDIFHGPIEPKP